MQSINTTNNNSNNGDGDNISEGRLTRLMLIFALYLEDIKEVGGGGVNLDQVLIVLWCGIGEVNDLELIRALE